MATQLVMYEEEFHRINAVCDRLTKDANAKVVFLVDKNGQLISAAGQTQNIDTTSLASLTAGNVAAMGGLAKLIGENEFPNQFHEGARDSLYMTIVGSRVVLVVIFDNRLLTKRYGAEVLASLPGCPVTRDLGALEKFFPSNGAPIE